MNEIQRAKIVFKILNKTYPSIYVPLKSRNVFTLLISVLLSAQCTDVNVNNVTKNIYPKFYKPIHFVKLGRKKIEKLIKKIGIFRIKAKSIYNLSKIIIEKHNGKVPKTFEELEDLPGVGHKTAGVVMSQGFGYPAFPIDTHIHRLAQRWGLTNGKVPKTFKELEELPGVGHKTASVVMSQGYGYPAFPIDTHIHRLAQRWGLTNGKNVVQTEKDLKRLFPKKYWNKLHLQIIYYGREYCKARECYGISCKICTSCYPKRKKPIKTKKA